MMMRARRDVLDVLLPVSLFMQNVMGYSPLQTGFAFLPFSFGIVIAATIAVQAGQPHRPTLHRRHRHR